MSTSTNVFLCFGCCFVCILRLSRVATKVAITVLFLVMCLLICHRNVIFIVAWNVNVRLLYLGGGEKYSLSEKEVIVYFKKGNQLLRERKTLKVLNVVIGYAQRLELLHVFV